MTAISEPLAPSTPDALAGRLFEAAVGAIDLISIYIGEKLGLYRALVGSGPATPAELAARTGTNERYVREWLEQQATTGLLLTADAAAAPASRRFSLPPEHAAVLADRDSLAFVAPLGRFMAATATALPQILEGFRTGRGVEWAAYGDEMRSAQADFNRPFFLHALADEYLAHVPGLDARLRAPGARVAEIGCGAGFASIAIARAYPSTRVDGYDLDAPSISEARRNAAEFDVADRVTFHCQDAGDAAIAGQFNFVCAIECVHDMADPVAALATMRRLAAPGATVLVVDERTQERFSPPGDLLERLLYGFSITVCLPCGLAEQPSAATGTVMRPDTLRTYAARAGFRDVRVLPLDHDLFYFYELIS